VGRNAKKYTVLHNCRDSLLLFLPFYPNEKLLRPDRGNGFHSVFCLPAKLFDRNSIRRRVLKDYPLFSRPFLYNRMEQIREANERGYKDIRRTLINPFWSINLLDYSPIHHRNPVRNGK